MRSGSSISKDPGTPSCSSHLILRPIAGKEEPLLVAQNKSEERFVRGSEPGKVHQHNFGVIREDVDGF
jgi:hypothetical protein